MTYLLIIVFLIILSAKFDFDDSIELKPQKEKVFWGVCTIFILVAGLRFNIGGDTTDAYAPEYFEFAKLGSANWRIELETSRYQAGWFVFESICRFISPNFLLLQFVHALFINIVYFYFIKKYSKLWFTAILIYSVSCFMKLNTEVLRESMAVAFALLSYDSKVEKRYVLMIIFAIMSYMFHISGFMCVILLLLSFVEDTKKNRKVLTFLFGTLTFSFASLNIDPAFLNLLFEENQVDEYFSQDIRYTYGILGWILYYVKTLIFPFIMLCFIPVEERDCKKISLIFLLYIFLMFLSAYTLAFNRFADYLFPFYWVAVSSFYENFSKKINHNYTTMILVLIIMYVFYTYYGSVFSRDHVVDSSFKMIYDRYYPYRSVLEDGNTYLK